MKTKTAGRANKSSRLALILIGLLLSALAAAQELKSPLWGPLRTDAGFSSFVSAQSGLVFVRELAENTAYATLMQPLLAFTLGNRWGDGFGATAAVQVGSLGHFAFTDQHPLFYATVAREGRYRYKAYDYAAAMIGCYLDAAELAGWPINLELGIEGGAALAMFPGTYMMFFMPVANAGLRGYLRLPLANAALRFSLDAPFLLPAQIYSWGISISVGLVYIPLGHKAAGPANVEGTP